MNDLIVAYKFGARLNGKLSPREGINLHQLHAQANGGKVLFTISKFPQAEYRDYITKIILMTKDGRFALMADVDFLGLYSSSPTPDGYTVPSVFNDEDKSCRGWFALSNLQPIEVNKGDYTSVNGKDLLDSMSGNAYMVYLK
ncbi:MAG: hypothetical protein UIM53_00225 [Acutalibacteraceae bacterium]|nr:hypothetical protein [Acutalibacteraceae bacterium]